MERNWRQGVASASSCDDWSQSCDCPNRIAFDGGRVSPQSDPVTRYAVLRTPVPVPRLCVLFFSLLSYLGTVNPLHSLFVLISAMRSVCAVVLILLQVLPCRLGSPWFLLRECSHTSKISRRSYGPDRSPPPTSVLSVILVS